MRYFIKIMNKAFGPYPEEDLKERWEQGKISGVEISADGKRWISAESLFSGGGPTSVYAGSVSVYEPVRAPEELRNERPNVAESPQEDRWFVSFDGQSCSENTYSTSQIETLIRERRIAGEALVWRNGENARSLSVASPFNKYFNSRSNELLQNSATTNVSDGGERSIDYDRLRRGLRRRFWTTAVSGVLATILMTILRCVNWEGNDEETLAILGFMLVNMCFYLFEWFELFFGLWKTVDPKLARTTPGKAVGFACVPLFYLYWLFVAFYGLALDLNKMLRKQGQSPIALSRSTLIYCIINCLWLGLFFVALCAGSDYVGFTVVYLIIRWIQTILEVVVLAKMVQAATAVIDYV